MVSSSDRHGYVLRRKLVFHGYEQLLTDPAFEGYVAVAVDDESEIQCE